ncbi:MAG: RNA polymerase sigma factor [bacterium]|nr:RNA polymerase sigma factor [bacterium]
MPPPNQISELTLELLHAHSGFVRRVAQSVVRGDADVSDAVQDTWLSVLRSGAKEEGASRGWLATILRRRVVDQFRSARSRAERERLSGLRPGPQTPDQIAVLEETRQRLVRGVLGLKEPYRSSVLLRYYHGASSADAASMLDIPVETHRTRVRRGLAQLRVRLERDGAIGSQDARASLLALAGIAPSTSMSPVVLVLGGLVLVVLGVAYWLSGLRLPSQDTALPPDKVSAGERAGLDRHKDQRHAAELSGRGGATSDATSVLETEATDRKGVWLIGNITSPAGLGDGVVMVSVEAGDRDGESRTQRWDVASDGRLHADLTSVIRDAGVAEPVRELRLTIDDPAHLRARVRVEVSRAARRAALSGADYQELSFETALAVAPFRVRGRVQLPGHLDPRSARVALLREGPSGVPVDSPVDDTHVDDTGEFVLRAATRGRHLVAISYYTPHQPALRPETARVVIESADTVLPEFVPQEGLSIAGRVTTPAHRAPIRLGLEASVQVSESDWGGWNNLIWLGDHFEYEELLTLAQEDGRYVISGLGPHAYRIEVGQGVWDGGQEIPTMYATEDRAKTRVTATAPSSDVSISFAYTVWLITARFQGGVPGLHHIGVPCYAKNCFFLWTLDADGRMAVFVPPEVADKEDHPFLGGAQRSRIRSRIDPRAWNLIEFPAVSLGETLDIVLPPELAEATDHYTLNFWRDEPGGRKQWMRGWIQLVREGNVLRATGLAAGKWSYKLEPRGRLVDFASFLRPTVGEVELIESAPNRLEVRPDQGGYLELAPLWRYAPKLGFPKVREGVWNMHKLAWRVMDDRAQAQALQACWREPGSDEYGHLRGSEELAYGVFGKERSMRFWPPLAPGRYVLELWTAKRREETLKSIPFDIEQRQITRLGEDG